MALKFALFLLCATVLISSQVESASFNFGLKAGIIDTIKEIVKRIEDLIDKLLPEVQNVVDTIKTDYSSFQSKINGVVGDVVNAALKVILRILNDLATDSTPAGKKLAECVNTAAPDIIGVFTSGATDLTTCGKDDLTKVISELGPLVSDLTTLHKDAKEVLKAMDNCQGDDVAGLLCVVDVVGNLIQTAADELPQLLADLAPVMKDLPELIESATKCYNEARPKFLTNGGKVLDQIATCAAA